MDYSLRSVLDQVWQQWRMAVICVHIQRCCWYDNTVHIGWKPPCDVCIPAAREGERERGMKEEEGRGMKEEVRREGGRKERGGREEGRKESTGKEKEGVRRERGGRK